MNLPERKQTRLQNYDYSQNGAYFITICTHNRKNLFQQAQGTGVSVGAHLQEEVKWFKTQTTNEYIKGVKLGIYKSFNKHIWQRGYYEHVIRGEQDLYEIRKYIHENPLKWELDCYYIN